MGSSASTNVRKQADYSRANAVSLTNNNTSLKPSVDETEEDNEIRTSYKCKEFTNTTDSGVYLNTNDAKGTAVDGEAERSVLSTDSKYFEAYAQDIYKKLRKQADVFDLEKCRDQEGNFVQGVIDVLLVFLQSYETFPSDDCGLLCKYRTGIGKILIETNVYELCSRAATSILQKVCEDREKTMDDKQITLLEISIVLLGNIADESDEVAIALGGDEALLNQVKGYLSISLEEETTQSTTATISLLRDKEMVESSLTLFHNASMREENLQNLRKLQLIDILQKYLASNAQNEKMLALATLAAIVNEDECSIIASNKESVVLFLHVLQKGLKEQDRRYDGWSCKELGLIVRMLARNDANKKLLVDLGALDLLVEMGKTGNEDEQYECVRAIRVLCFDSSNQLTICNDADLGVVDLLVVLKGSSHRGIVKACNGALWTLADALEKSPIARYKQLVKDAKARAGQHVETEMEIMKPNSSPTSKQGHIMISYQWADQKTLKSIRNVIQTKKYKVWMDIDHMAGSTIQAMAEAVENSEIVLICMSQKYKDSENCRAEAEYAFKMKKCVIPLKLERNYVPDGWLGLICGAKYFHEFTDKYPFEQQLQKLLKEIDGKMCPEGSTEKHIKQEVPIATQHQEAVVFDYVDAAAPPPKQSLVPRTLSVPNTTVVGIVRKWTQGDLSKWWNEYELKGCLPASVTASEIAMLLKMHQESPDFLYRCLYDMFKIRNPLSMSKVIWALQDILEPKHDV